MKIPYTKYFPVSPFILTQEEMLLTMTGSDVNWTTFLRYLLLIDQIF